jgi:hypothetical protein
MPDARKRPYSTCRRWFRPDPRVGARQRTCRNPECQAGSRRLEVHRLGRPVTEDLMAAFPVVEPEVVVQTRDGVADAQVVPEIDFFEFHRSPEPFHEDVVGHPAATVHADPSGSRVTGTRTVPWIEKPEASVPTF